MEIRLKVFVSFASTLAFSVILMVASIFLHNYVSAWTVTEDAVFFAIAIVVAPVLIMIGAVGSLASAIVLLVRRKA